MVSPSPSTGRNLLVTFIDTSDSRRRFSELSITTTPDPLCGFVITMPSHFFRSVIAYKRALGLREVLANPINILKRNRS